jgi:ferritin-like metal-binding protein YciE
MSTEPLAEPHHDLADLYLDALWDLHAGFSLVLRLLPRMAEAVSSPRLATAMRDALGPTSHAVERLSGILSDASRPGRGHAPELETLTGEAARRLSDWPHGVARDAGVGTVLRTALHLMIPYCELTSALADAVGAHLDAVTIRALDDLLRTTDATLRRLLTEAIAM